MKRREFLKLTGIGAAALALQGCMKDAESRAKGGYGRPNILFCIADDWGWPHAGAYGDKVVKLKTQAGKKYRFNVNLDR